MYGQYKSRGNRRVHEAYSSIVYIFDDEADITELPHHVHRHHLLLLNGVHGTRQTKSGRREIGNKQFLGTTTSLARHVWVLPLSLWKEV